MSKTKYSKDKKTQELIETIIDGIQDVKGKEIVVMDMTKLPNAVSQYFVICSGDSSTQVDGIAQTVVRKTRAELQEKPWHQEGMNNAEWVLLDYVNVVVHVFYRDRRGFYNLEDLWADAEFTQVEVVY